MSPTANRTDIISNSSRPSEEELRWAARIKEAATADPDIDAEEMSDWEFLQHAIVAKQAIPKALQRIRNLQAFKRRYGILLDGSVEEAIRDLTTFLQTHPNLYLSLAEAEAEALAVNSNDQPSSQIFCSAYKHFNAARMKSEEAYKVYMRAAFYVLNASQHSLAALRSGLVLLMDMTGALTYRSFQTENRARQLYVQAYPVRIEKVALLNATLSMRVAHQMLRPFLSVKVRQLLSLEADGQAYLQTAAFPPDTLPQAWQGNLPVDAFYDTIVERLQKRYHMVKTFRL